MKDTGIIRHTDGLGRIVIPVELRKKLHIAEGDPLDIFVDGESIILSKYEQGCIFTNTSDDLVEYMGRKVSKAAIAEMAKLVDIA